MTDAVNRFYNSIKDADKKTPNSLIEFFTYFLTVELGEPAVTAGAINQCYRDCDLQLPSRLPQYLSDNTLGKAPKFVKASVGYKLHRHRKDAIAKELGAERVVVQVSAELRKLEPKVGAGPRKEFLKETIDCFEAGASRASIIMCWILVLDHLFDFVITRHLADFNTVLSKVNDRRVKVSSITVKDDFGDIPESKFIELLRSAGIISNDVRKILDEKLGVRNSCAHPSGVAIKPSKAIDYIEDLIENVMLKYPI